MKPILIVFCWAVAGPAANASAAAATIVILAILFSSSLFAARLRTEAFVPVKARGLLQTWI